MISTRREYTVRKVEVYRLFDEKGQEVEQYDDEYGDPYPLDFASEAAAWEHVASEESIGFHGSLTKEADERQAAIWGVYRTPLLANLKANTPFMSLYETKPLPANGGKSIQFFTHESQ